MASPPSPHIADNLNTNIIYMLRAALRKRLEAVPLHPSPRRHRCRMVYDLSQPTTLSSQNDVDAIALPQVEAAHT